MKCLAIFVMLNSIVMHLYAQQQISDRDRNSIVSLIDQYSDARASKDTVSLRHILTNDIDQLVSTGEWRDGMQSAVQGMLKSTTVTPGTRSLFVEKLRLLSNDVALVDCRYEIAGKDGQPRKMWSTFIVVKNKNSWKISAIRNMLPGKS